MIMIIIIIIIIITITIIIIIITYCEDLLLREWINFKIICRL